tara:strand:+ start:1722 stop:1931 length:210 start_codon:yes stop_codon:yes gene_type:complete
MKYVLAHYCNYDDYEGECGELSYLIEESEDGKIKKVKEFLSKFEAEHYIKFSKWNPEDIMIMPKKEMVE